MPTTRPLRDKEIKGAQGFHHGGKGVNREKTPVFHGRNKKM